MVDTAVTHITTTMMAVSLSSILQDVIRTNQSESIEVHLTKSPTVTRQAELVACLNLAMLEGSTEMIGLLLDLGAELSVYSLASAVARQEPEVFRLLIDSGWDINSTMSSLSAIQCT